MDATFASHERLDLMRRLLKLEREGYPVPRRVEFAGLDRLRFEVEWLENLKRKYVQAQEREREFEDAARRVEAALNQMSIDPDASKALLSFAGEMIPAVMPKDGELMPLDDVKEFLAHERERERKD